MTESLMRLKRERFHLEIRRQRLEEVLKKKRIQQPLPLALNNIYPIEKFIEIINRMNFEELKEEDQNILKCVLDMIYNTILTDWPQFQHWANHMSIVESLLLTMQYQCNQEVAEKASNCFQLLIKMKTQKMLVEEHLNKFVEIYKTWFESPQLRDTAVTGLYHLVQGQHFRNLNDADLVESLLKIYYDKDKSEQHGKVLQVLGEITKNLSDDQKIIKIVRLAAKLIEHTDNKLKIKGLRILENATSNVQNIQFLLSMNSMQLIMDMVTHKDKLISELCIQIVYNLCFTIDKDEMQKLLDLGCLNIVLRLIKNGNIQQRQKAAYIMSNMMASDCVILEQIMQASVLIEILIDKMRTESPQVKINIFHCWKNFVIASNTDLLIQFLNYQILDDLIYGLQDDAKFAILCLEILSQIIYKLSGTMYEMEVKAYLEDRQLSTIIENIRTQEDEEVLYEACCKFQHQFYDRDIFQFDQRGYNQCF